MVDLNQMQSHNKLTLVVRIEKVTSPTRLQPCSRQRFRVNSKVTAISNESVVETTLSSASDSVEQSSLSRPLTLTL